LSITKNLEREENSWLDYGIAVSDLHSNAFELHSNAFRTQLFVICIHCNPYICRVANYLAIANHMEPCKYTCVHSFIYQGITACNSVMALKGFGSLFFFCIDEILILFSTALLNYFLMALSYACIFTTFKSISWYFSI